jgi:hypothetical protein
MASGFDQGSTFVQFSLGVGGSGTFVTLLLQFGIPFAACAFLLSLLAWKRIASCGRVGV